MAETVVRVERLGKRYRLGARKSHTTVRARAGVVLERVLGRRAAGAGRGGSRHIWAIREVSFEISRGQVVGVIGGNGSGKSTLLRILARITDPTEGYAEIRGRMGSLLEVGTGFHPELTGRENIYMNGAILGMRKAELARKLDEILDFSGIEAFVDTPVKHYSSGMYVRLAFAVAAHLEPEILLLDEVLAVGDAAFQRKCLVKMSEVARQGRTVLFVSHNMAYIRKLCGVCLELREGRVVAFGEADSVTAAYEANALRPEDAYASPLPIADATAGLTLEGLKVDVVPQDDGVKLWVEVRVHGTRRLRRVGVAILIQTHRGDLIAKLRPRLTGGLLDELDGRRACIFECPRVDRFLASGDYSLGLAVNLDGVRLLTAEHAAFFRVPARDTLGAGQPFVLYQHGLVPLPLTLKEVIPG
jgi:lipopolysaccharide transport system ATP-binding protein